MWMAPLRPVVGSWRQYIYILVKFEGSRCRMNDRQENNRQENDEQKKAQSSAAQDQVIRAALNQRWTASDAIRPEFGTACQCHFFSSASQFTTTLIGSGACAWSGEFTRKRFPSAATSNGSHAVPIRFW
jgi:hypothetical protein